MKYETKIEIVCVVLVVLGILGILLQQGKINKLEQTIKTQNTIITGKQIVTESYDTLYTDYKTRECTVTFPDGGIAYITLDHQPDLINKYQWWIIVDLLKTTMADIDKEKWEQARKM